MAQREYLRSQTITRTAEIDEGLRWMRAALPGLEGPEFDDSVAEEARVHIPKVERLARGTGFGERGIGVKERVDHVIHEGRGVFIGRAVAGGLSFHVIQAGM